MSKIGKAKGCVGGLILGSAARAIIFIIVNIIKALASVMVFLGLWVPFFYALLGSILYLLFQFDPFSGDIDSKIFLIGFGGSVFCALLITVKNLFRKPAQSIVEGFKKPIWQKRTEEDSEYSPHNRSRYKRRYQDEPDTPQQLPSSRRSRYKDDNDNYESNPQPYSRTKQHYQDNNATPQYNIPKAQQPQIAAYGGNAQIAETPKVYYSSLESNTMIHEYSDRFEVFRIIDGRLLKDKVEYKNL